MTKQQQATDFIQAMQAAGCCCCLTSLLALGKARGLGLDAIMQALDTVKQERLQAMEATR